jgi:uncharacterized protein (DUF2267 family)
MSASGLDVFDKTLQTTHIWLDALMRDEAHRPGPADRLACARRHTLRAVRDRVPLDLAARLGAQLPPLVRGAYYDQFRPAEQPEHLRSLDEFLEHIGAEQAMMPSMNVRDATRAVFPVLSRHVSEG